MITYVCPEEITDLFKTDPGKGRFKAIVWAMGLDLKIGDKVWMPEIGWVEYTADSYLKTKH